MRVGLALMGLAIAVEPAMAGDSLPSYGFEFVTIGDPGNRDTDASEVPTLPEMRVGGVAYEYRMATTEVTIEQYIEFVEAYYPIYVKNTGDVIASPKLTGAGIHAAFGEVFILPGYSPDRAANMGWEYAARYVNWLHNGKLNEEWAFENGVYDTSTFYEDDAGVAHHQSEHHPGSRFWMPSVDEWAKAGYWDPEKNDGAGGYWIFPNGSDIEPFPALPPSEGGGRNAGPSGPGEEGDWPLDVRSFQDVQSPWGIYDMAGGEAEHLETIVLSGDRSRRYSYGSNFSQWGYGDLFSRDKIGHHSAHGMLNKFGLRIASPVQLPADLNQDGDVNFFDVSFFITRYIKNDSSVDLNFDGVVDTDDMYVFARVLAAQL